MFRKDWYHVATYAVSENVMWVSIAVVAVVLIAIGIIAYKNNR